MTRRLIEFSHSTSVFCLGEGMPYQIPWQGDRQVEILTITSTKHLNGEYTMRVTEVGSMSKAGRGSCVSVNRLKAIKSGVGRISYGNWEGKECRLTGDLYLLVTYDGE